MSWHGRPKRPSAAERPCSCRPLNRGDPMPLTPADVHNVVFKKPPIGKRGYDEDEVDAFLDVVEAELARLIEENSELRAAAGGRGGPVPERVEAPAPAPAPVVAAAPPPPVAQPREDDSARASRMLALATE